MIKRFHKGALLRNIHTGKPLLVIQCFSMCTLVVDLEAPSPATIQALLQRDYGDWVDDLAMDRKKNGNDTIWKYHGLTL